MMGILTKDVELIELTDLFCNNHKSFYLYIAKYAAASDRDENEKDIKPLRLHKIENIIDCIFSPNLLWSFYNKILDTDIYNTIKQYHRYDNDKIMKRILSLASHYKCPIRSKVKPTAFDTQKLLKHYGFFEILDTHDTFQFIDFYHVDNVLKYPHTHPDIKIIELDDLTQTNCRMRKSEWSYVLCESFGLNIEINGPFYSNVWSRVEVGPNKPIRMFIALKNDRIVGGCHISLACGIACLFNLVTLKNERGQGIGKSLSLIAMIAAKELNYRYMVLETSSMGLPIYQKLGFKPIPSYKTFIKFGTAAWYFKTIEILLRIFGIQSLQLPTKIIQKWSKTFLFVLMIVIISMSIVIARIFG
jgi:GNAT superfamily N-acetyltransferase